MLATNYIVTWGVNEYHLTENEGFNLYRDAVAFYNKINRNEFKAGVVYKLICGAKEGELGTFVVGLEAKRHFCEGDNTHFLNMLIRQAQAVA
ncbi:hypothetical protein [Photobacterium leiognathi]|uniref:hypothetical protein n=1 Tax=Photobacterium leiognathi TaxID=553611 RepID=UPI002981B012|nr:hypothetical protein [Photobacterium leiognathi]